MLYEVITGFAGRLGRARSGAGAGQGEVDRHRRSGDREVRHRPGACGGRAAVQRLV